MAEHSLGIFGGTFNPIHIAHLVIATFFVEEYDLNKCFFVPNYLPPLKSTDEELATPEHRKNMIRIAISGNPKFELEEFEINRGEISYTYETVAYFRNSFPNSKIFLLIGSDQALKFAQWKNWLYIVENVNLVVANRPLSFISKNYLLSYLNKNIQNDSLNLDFEEKINILNCPLIEISSSDIRKRIKLGLNCSYLLTREVENYIIENRLYR
ncbi:MAG: nicotinate (nicotinamide) nucleotide adenylyltransferase [Ignavibacteria bacterium]|nr:nicotinate (nicotinamide) nucleotide adenylyltransferase [Ignavibacteria bacterium]